MAHGGLKRCLERSLRCLPRAAGPLTAWPTSCASAERAGRCLMTLAAHSRSSQEPQASLLPLGLPPLGKLVCEQPCAGAHVLRCARRLSSGSGGDGKDADAAEQASRAQSATESAGAARADGGPPESAASAAAGEPGLSSAASSAAADDAGAAGGAAQQAPGSPAADGAAGAGAGAGEAAEPAAAAGHGSGDASGAGEAGTEGHASRELKALASGSDSGEEGWESGEDWSEDDFDEDDFDEEGVETRLEQGAAEREAWLKTLSPKMRRKIANVDRIAQRRLRRRVLEGDPDEGLTDEERRLRREERARAAAVDVRDPGPRAAVALASPEGPRLCCTAGARYCALRELVHGRLCVKLAVPDGIVTSVAGPLCACRAHKGRPLTPNPNACACRAGAQALAAAAGERRRRLIPNPSP